MIQKNLLTLTKSCYDSTQSIRKKLCSMSKPKKLKYSKQIPKFYEVLTNATLYTKIMSTLYIQNITLPVYLHQDQNFNKLCSQKYRGIYL